MRCYPTLAEVERRYILSILTLCANNRTRAARILGVSIRGLRLKLHNFEGHGFDVPPPPSNRKLGSYRDFRAGR